MVELSADEPKVKTRVVAWQKKGIDLLFEKEVVSQQVDHYTVSLDEKTAMYVYENLKNELERLNVVPRTFRAEVKTGHLNRFMRQRTFTVPATITTGIIPNPRPSLFPIGYRYIGETTGESPTAKNTFYFGLHPTQGWGFRVVNGHARSFVRLGRTDDPLSKLGMFWNAFPLNKPMAMGDFRKITFPEPLPRALLDWRILTGILWVLARLGRITRRGTSTKDGPRRVTYLRSTEPGVGKKLVEQVSPPTQQTKDARVA